MDEYVRGRRAEQWGASVRAFRESVRLYTETLARVQRTRRRSGVTEQSTEWLATDGGPSSEPAGQLSARSRLEQDDGVTPPDEIVARPAAVAGATAVADGQASMDDVKSRSVALEVVPQTGRNGDGALAPGATRGNGGSRRSLTPRQCEVAALIAQGMTNAEIASRLVLTPGTVANHVEHMLQRLGYRSRAQIAVWAEREGLGDADAESA